MTRRPSQSLPLIRVLALAIVLSAASCPVLAGTGGERDALARLAHEVAALEPLIDVAEAEASPDARVRFRYDWLRADLKAIQRGIQDHLNAPRAQPRTLPPLRGDYRE